MNKGVLLNEKLLSNLISSIEYLMEEFQTNIKDIDRFNWFQLNSAVSDIFSNNILEDYIDEEIINALSFRIEDPKLNFYYPLWIYQITKEDHIRPPLLFEEDPPFSILRSIIFSYIVFVEWLNGKDLFLNEIRKYLQRFATNELKLRFLSLIPIRLSSDENLSEPIRLNGIKFTINARRLKFELKVPEIYIHRYTVNDDFSSLIAINLYRQIMPYFLDITEICQRGNSDCYILVIPIESIEVINLNNYRSTIFSNPVHLVISFVNELLSKLKTLTEGIIKTMLLYNDSHLQLKLLQNDKISIFNMQIFPFDIPIIDLKIDTAFSNLIYSELPSDYSKKLGHSDLDKIKNFWNKYGNIMTYTPTFLEIAIRRYWRVLFRQSILDKIIDLIIALESLFGDGGGSIRYKLALRASYVIGINDLDIRKGIFKTLKKLYDLRSKIVHGGILEEEFNKEFMKIVGESGIIRCEDTNIEDCIWKIRRIIYDALIFYLENLNQGISKKDDIINYIDERILKGENIRLLNLNPIRDKR